MSTVIAKTSGWGERAQPGMAYGRGRETKYIRFTFHLKRDYTAEVRSGLLTEH